MADSQQRIRDRLTNNHL